MRRWWTARRCRKSALPPPRSRQIPGRGAVEGDRDNAGISHEQPRDIVQSRLPDRRIQAFETVGAFHHIPKRNSALKQQPLPIGDRKLQQRRFQQQLHHSPELVYGMRIIVPIRQRAAAGQAAQQQNGRVPLHQRRQAGNPRQRIIHRAFGSAFAVSHWEASLWEPSFVSRPRLLPERRRPFSSAYHDVPAPWWPWRRRIPEGQGA